VEQHPILFVGTIAENILYGRLDASREEVIEAARAARIHESITKMPRNYDTLVGERGATLSGGERQRLSIARAFLKNAPILVLDEPTAFIDSRTEADVLDALRELRRGRTTFMVSHRMAAIRDADRILVMQDGRIVERGSHRELCANKGLYQELSDIVVRTAGT
jgi:ABC-type multidrug transport system fused ATPase/permease subunit